MMNQVNVEQVKEFIKAMTLTDAAKLVHDLEEELGVSAAAPVAIAATSAAPSAGGAAAAAEEKTEFTVTLTDVGSEKIKVIKVVRELTSLGLKEAKEVVDNTPKVLKEGVTKQEAATMKAKLEEVGAKIEVK